MVHMHNMRGEKHRFRWHT